MFNTKFGAFNGKTWEDLCQQAFKRMYRAECYQQMQASPGDFGIEGFTLNTGWAFQCYCPEKHYERSELYGKLRNKISEDLAKLKLYEKDLLARLGSTKLARWVFVSPEIDKNRLLMHARTKEVEVRGWNLPFLTNDFTVLLHDGDHYIIEINEIRSASGEPLVFDGQAPVLAELSGQKEDYERNIYRKCDTRLAHKATLCDYAHRVTAMSQRTVESFLEADGYFRRIAETAPLAYLTLIRLINEYEQHVIETSATWNGAAEELTSKVREGLEQRVVDELGPEFDHTSASKVARYMTARWLAVCELNYD